MLVLSRKQNEKSIVEITEDAMRKALEMGVTLRIDIAVVEIRGDKVRLGFDAPREVPVHREEVYDAIKRSKVEAKPSDGAAVTPEGSTYAGG